MTRFSEYLERIITQSGMKEKDLAQITGFARSYIALMKNGQRVSPDIEKMHKLMYALKLSPYEVEVFKEEYHRARIGDYAYERDKEVMNFIFSFNDISKFSIKEKYEYEIPEVQTITDSMNMERLAKAIIKKEALKENGFVHIIMQGQNQLLKSVFTEVCGANKDLPVEHIVCMEHAREAECHEEFLYNIRMLRDFVPITVFSHSRNYKIYYYYDHVVSKYNIGNLLSYMILTSEYLICMNSDMTLGTITKEKEVRDLYEELFQKSKKNCKELFLHFDEQDKVEFVKHIRNRMESTTYSISQQPFFGVLKLEYMMKRYAHYFDKDTYMSLYKIIRSNSEKMETEGYRHVSYCTKEGLRRFAQKGEVDELPKNIRLYLQKRDRITVLESMLDLLEHGKYELYFLKDNETSISKDLFVHVYGLSNVMIFFGTKDRKTEFILHENSLSGIIYESLRNLFKNPKVSSLEEGKQYLQELITELRL